jgi:UDP-glucose 4-epimerase
LKILITGGAGFIGSHLSELLLQDPNNHVTVLDSLSTGSYANIRTLVPHPNYRLIVGPVSDKNLLETLIADCDQIYHLAAAVGVRLIIERPVETIETNIIGTDIILNLAAKYHKKVLVASTSEVYGKSNKFPFQEDDDTILGPTSKSRWSYACTKALDEFLALAYHREKGLPAVIVRLFNTVGPRQTGRYGMVVPNLVQQALKGAPLTVYGDGQQSRCFTHVRDSIKCQVALMQEPRAVGEIFNLGSRQEVTIEQLAQRILDISGSKSTIQYIPYEEAYEPGFDDMRRRVPDTTKLHNMLGFAADSQLDDILQDVIAYYRENPSS